MGPGGFRRLQNDCDLTTSGWVGSIPTRSRHRAPGRVPSGNAGNASAGAPPRGGNRFGVLCGYLAVAASMLLAAGDARAQRPDSAATRADSIARARADSITHARTDSLARVRADSDARVRADSATRAAPTRQAVAGRAAGRDSLSPPISPGRAFLYSFALPGLGQARLRRFTGAIYVTVEAVAIAMTTKAANDLRIARAHAHDVVIGSYATDPAIGAPTVDAQGAFVAADTVVNRNAGNRVKARRTHVEDWVALLVFNHLFAAADAFVAAHLWDLPARVEIRSTPRGPALGVSVRW